MVDHVFDKALMEEALVSEFLEVIEERMEAWWPMASVERHRLVVAALHRTLRSVAAWDTPTEDERRE